MKQRKRKSWLVPILVGAFVVGPLLGAGPASASHDTTEVNTTVVNGVCMQRVFMGPDAPLITPSNRLNCTANDISLAQAIEETIFPTSCDPADGPFTLEVDFVVNVTANNRYDAGFFFRVDGGLSARGDDPDAAGECTLVALDKTTDLVLDEDGDSCGDLDQGQVTLRFEIPNVQCVAAPGTDPPVLRLPYCTSWHSNQGTACSNTDSFTLNPDTKSKCVCDDTFTVPVIVEQPSGTVGKTAITALVTYQIDVTNDSGVAVKLTALSDNVYGNLFLDKGSLPTANTKIEDTTCAAVASIAAGATSTCTFQVLVSNPGTGGAVPDTVTATLERVDGQGDPQTFTGNTSINIDLGADNRPPAP